MKTSLNWIKDLVPGIKDVDNHVYRDAMTLSGTKVEGFEELNKNLDKIVVGKILSVEGHPDADKLVVCQVEVGADKPVQIVTGAPNVRPGDSGQLVITVLDGGKVAGGHSGQPAPEDGIKIKKDKLRGIESCGMMCALEELGANPDLFADAPENGIYILDSNSGLEPGDDPLAYLGLDDTIFEYEVTNNRVDCYSLIGIAREAAATFKSDFLMPEVKATGNNENVEDYISVEVKDEDLCHRYTARVVKDIKIGPSPKWMQDRLRASGIRPINNIVDITNYVMEEYGQPMHAYDYDTIADHKIVVKRAADKDTFTTLDGNERKLDKDILMIADGQRYVGIAGIMGGDNSKITDDIKTLLLEAATFDGTNIRKSAKRLSMRTDASGKFEKGLDPELALEAMNRACALIEELGAGQVVGGLVDIYPNPVEKKHIPFEADRYNKLLGTDISEEEMLSYFKPIEIEYKSTKKELIIPTFRQDLTCFADIAEEVARFFGYDNIPVSLPKGTNQTQAVGGISEEERIRVVAMDTFEALGFSQALTYSFESPKVFDKLKLDKDAKERNTIVISNPLGEDFSVMRTLPINGMLTALATNYSRKNENAALYEFATVYIPTKEGQLPDERTQMTLGFYGEGDFFDMKGVLEDLFDRLGIKENRKYIASNKRPFLHPGRQALVEVDGVEVAYIGEVHPDVSDTYNIGTKTFIAVVDTPALAPFISFDIKYKGIANFPAVTRDVSLVMNKETPVGKLEEIISKRGGKLVESYKLFDIYEGAQIKEGCKSVAYNISFRANDRTLTDKDINPIMDKIFEDFEKEGFELRK